MVSAGKTNIVLIGMPGAGKSTLGVLLAKALGKAFVDTDLLIQSKTGQLLQEIIAHRGVDGFLKVEEEVLLEFAATNTVVATGGSAVYSGIAMKHLKEQGIVVYLKLSYRAIEDRISNIASRGIAMGQGQRLEDLYHERSPLYLEYADLMIDCEMLSIEEAVSELIAALKRMEV